MTLKCEFLESAREELPNQEPSPNGHGSHEKRRLKNDGEEEDEEAEEDGVRLAPAPERLRDGHHSDHDLPPPTDEAPLLCDLVYCGPMGAFVSVAEEPTTEPLSPGL